MRGTVVSLLALAVSFLAAQGTSHAQSTAAYNASGDYAETSFTTANNLSVTLYVARGCTTAPPCETTTGTVLYYFAEPTVPNPNGPNYVTEADGFIPDGDYQANNLQHMTLNVDTSQVPGFTVESCAFVNGVFNCVSGPYAAIQATWDATQQQSSKVIQDASNTIGGFTTKVHDDMSSTSAAATGSFQGYAFSSTTSTTMGTNKSHTVNITRPQ